MENIPRIQTFSLSADMKSLKLSQATPIIQRLLQIFCDVASIDDMVKQSISAKRHGKAYLNKVLIVECKCASNILLRKFRWTWHFFLILVFVNFPTRLHVPAASPRLIDMSDLIRGSNDSSSKVKSFPVERPKDSRRRNTVYRNTRPT